MTTVPHDRPVAKWWTITDVWASLAITAMWIAVIVTAIAGPDIKSADNTGNGAVVPAVILVALFAAIGSAAVAKYGFRRRD